jgi:large conductance mechanosensitive channel
MGFMKDFKAFLLEKDIVAYAVAFIMALALKTVVNSLVDDFVMPVVSLLTGGADFTKYFVALDGNTYATLEAAKEAGAAAITYGNLIQAVINFIFIGFVVFILVKIYEKTKKKKEEAPAGPSKEEVLLTEIRDELKKRNA